MHTEIERVLCLSSMDESSILRRRGLQVGNVERLHAGAVASSGVSLLLREHLMCGVNNKIESVSLQAQTFHLQVHH